MYMTTWGGFIYHKPLTLSITSKQADSQTNQNARLGLQNCFLTLNDFVFVRTGYMQLPPGFVGQSINQEDTSKEGQLTRHQKSTIRKQRDGFVVKENID